MNRLSAVQLHDQLAALPAGRMAMAALSDVDGVYVVGGSLRDLLLGRRPADLDLVAEGDLGPLVRRLGSPERSHERFGTATVTVDGTRLDLARARRERYPRPGALPEVAPAPLTEDLLRRDFTVNAIALPLRDGAELIAVPNALQDLAAGRLRVLHDASFRDDPTRLLRLARYGARLGFAPEPHTLALARAAVNEGALETVSPTRLGAELRLALAEGDPVAALEALEALGIIAALIPGLTTIDRELTERALRLVPAEGDPGTVVLAAAVRGVAPGALGAALDRLGFDAGRRGAVVAAAGRADSLAAALAGARSPSQIARAVTGSAPETVALAGALGPEIAARRWLDELRHIGADIDGDDLIAAGAQPGPGVGVGLRAALEHKLDTGDRDREAQVRIALNAAQDAARK